MLEDVLGKVSPGTDLGNGEMRAMFSFEWSSHMKLTGRDKVFRAYFVMLHCCAHKLRAPFVPPDGHEDFCPC